MAWHIFSPFCVLVVAYTVREITCLTNAELYNLVKSQVTEYEIESNEEIDPVLEAYGDVIDLPGGPDDEVDVEYIAQRLAEINAVDNVTVNGEPYLDLTPSHEDLGVHASCHCRRYSCSCCGSQTFRVKLFGHRIRFTLKVCVKAAFLRNGRGFEVSITVNGHRVYHRRLSLRHSISLCKPIPRFPFAKVCVTFYNINLRSRSFCVRLTGKLTSKIKIHFKLGCFRIPILDDDDVFDHVIKYTSDHVTTLYAPDTVDTHSTVDNFESLDVLQEVLGLLQNLEDSNPEGDNVEDDNPEGNSVEDDNPEGDSLEGASHEGDNLEGDSQEDGVVYHRK